MSVLSSNSRSSSLRKITEVDEDGDDSSFVEEWADNDDTRRRPSLKRSSKAFRKAASRPSVHMRPIMHKNSSTSTSSAVLPRASLVKLSRSISGIFNSKPNRPQSMIKDPRDEDNSSTGTHRKISVNESLNRDSNIGFYDMEVKKSKCWDSWRNGLSLFSIFGKAFNYLRHGVTDEDTSYEIFEWCFDATFSWLLFSFLMVYLSMCVIFALILYGLAKAFPHCIEHDADSYSANFLSTYLLSWTTFSTVGYGTVSPNSFEWSCALFNIITSIEAYVGVLYSSLCGAITFSKVLKAQSGARVIFSTPICIKYFTTLTPSMRSSSIADINDSKCLQTAPVLQFRLGNKDGNRMGRELLDAKASAIVIFKSKQKIPPGRRVLMKQSDSERRFQGPKRSATSSKIESRAKSNSLTNNVAPSFKFAFEEHADGGYHKQTHHNLEFKVSENAFFENTWCVQHVLNSDSPLLKHSVRRMLLKNKGWPDDLMDYYGIRSSLQEFDRIILKLSGTTQSRYSQVYCWHTYTFDNVVIGYDHCEVLFTDDKGNEKIDISLFNTIFECAVGCGEPMDDCNMSDSEEREEREESNSSLCDVAMLEEVNN